MSVLAISYIHIKHAKLINNAIQNKYFELFNNQH